MDDPRAQFAAARVASLATADADGVPHIVPLVFVVVGDTLYSCVDHKPKTTTALRRLRNISQNPRVSLLVDRYDDDWSQLWWVRADGEAEILEPQTPEAEKAIDALARKYSQYVDTRPDGQVIAVRNLRWSSWESLPGNIISKTQNIVSLSHVNDPATTPIFPGDPEFTLDTAATIEADGYYLQHVKQGEHTGTHWGAPAHFEIGGLTADQLDPADLYLPAVKIDVRAQAGNDADYVLTVADLEEWESQYGRIPNGSAIIAWTGWESRWGTDSYANNDSSGVCHQPGFSIEGVQWLLTSGRLGRRGALGIDTFGPDAGNDSSYAVSKLLYGERRISLENLANLSALPTTGAHILVGGTVNRGGSGSPATIYALLG